MDGGPSVPNACAGSTPAAAATGVRFDSPISSPVSPSSPTSVRPAARAGDAVVPRRDRTRAPLHLAEAEVSGLYTALLEHIGCSGFAHEASARYGDELVVNAAAARTNVSDPRDVFGTFMPAVTRGRGPSGGRGWC
jgi:hypothetical protein